MPFYILNFSPKLLNIWNSYNYCINGVANYDIWPILIGPFFSL